MHSIAQKALFHYMKRDLVEDMAHKPGSDPLSPPRQIPKKGYIWPLFGEYEFQKQQFTQSLRNSYLQQAGRVPVPRNL